MDRNQVIGLSLLAILLGIYLFTNNSEQKALESERQKQEQTTSATDTSKQSDNSAAIVDTVGIQDTTTTELASNAVGEDVKIANDLMELTFNTKGASVKKAHLKNYKTFWGEPLVLFDGDENFMDFTIPFQNQIIHTKEHVFTPSVEGNQIKFVTEIGGNEVDIIYDMIDGQYMMNAAIQLNGQLIQKPLSVQWQNEALHTEQDLKNERMNSQFYYSEWEDKSVDYYTVKENEEEEYEEKMRWLSIKPAFFNTTIISKDAGFDNIRAKSNYSEEDTMHVSQTAVSFDMAPTPDHLYEFQLFIGPNDYDLLKSYQMDLEKIVPMGRGIFEFVKYINRGMILPIFEYLSKFISNYGVIIMILTLFIRLLLSFFTYKSYLSQAKMQALKPELDEIKEKYKDDQKALGAEQMKLYSQAGVNPLGGCLPSLFQLPFLIAMYSFFPSSIQLRQQGFLWCQDLSTYDSIVSWSTHIPLISTFYGNHISLFTVLLTITSLILALYNSSMTADQNNPALKYLPYVMPVMFLGFFNNMAAGLTFYYFFSNLISIVQQWVIKNYVIDKEKIRAQLLENKKKPATQSKFAQRLAEMQKENEERKAKVNAQAKKKKK